MVFELPFTAFHSELYNLFTMADEMDFSVYDSSLGIDEIVEPLKTLEEINFGVISDVTCTQTAAKTDSVVWTVNVRIDMFSTYKGRKRIAEMANTIGSVATQYAEAFNINLSNKGYSVIKQDIGESLVGSATIAYGLQWQTGYIKLQYQLYQLNT